MAEGEEEEPEFQDKFESASIGDISGLSDSDEELEIFDPMPYAFILKDVHRKKLNLPAQQLYNSRISCPPLHVLVDHLVAVLWCFYSGRGHEKLGTAQLHWAVKFMEGLRDSNNRQIADVRMAIDDLEEALIERGSAVNEEDVEKRKYGEDLESTQLPVPLGLNANDSGKGYEEFVKNLKGLKGKQSESKPKSGEDGGEEGGEESPIVDKTIPKGEGPFNIPEIRVESPSIILNCMLSEEPDTMMELLETTVANLEGTCQAPGAEVGDGGDKTTSLTSNVADVKNNLIQRIIKDLENLKAIDETLRDLKCDSNPQLALKLKDIIDLIGKK